MDASVIKGLFIIMAFLEVNSKNLCNVDKTRKCDCFNNGEYEFQCPAIKNNVLIKSTPNKNLEIECKDLDVFNMDFLPQYKAGDVKFVSFKYCPLPDDNFQPILTHFGINNFTIFKLENVTIPESSLNQTISKDLFRGLSNIKELELTNIYYKLEDDVLDYLPNLSNFVLDHSEVDDISTLKFPPSLKVLHLTGSIISDVPVGLFKNLNKLYQLHLWGNNITRIQNNTFVGLHNLTSLELSSNSIEDIEEDGFADLKKLRSINLRLNRLNKVSVNIFKHNKYLDNIRMEDNPKLVLPDYLFADLPNLDIVNLKNSGIEDVPENLFRGSKAVRTIKLHINRLKNLPERIFYELTKLENLDLSRNMLSSLPDEIFLSLNSLVDLNLSFNNLSNITNELFRKTEKLKILNLRYNKISFIEFNSFYYLGSLTSLDLSHNRFKMTYSINENPFNNILKLESLMLRNNLIEELPDFNNLIYLQTVDLSYNSIKDVPVHYIISQPSESLKLFNLSNNAIKYVDLKYVDVLLEANNPPRSQVQVDLQNNPLVCDCTNYDLVQYCQQMKPKVTAQIYLQVGGTRCTQPEIFQDIQIQQLKPENVSCEKPVKGCPKECKSFWRPFKSFLVFDCSNRNLTSFPKIPVNDHENVELNLIGNDIRGGLNSSLGYQNVKNLFLSNNKLQELKWIPQGIEKLTLDRNELTHLDPELLEIMNNASLKILKLSHNPWSCGCSALNLQIFIKDNFRKFQINSADVICRDDNKPLVEKRELCKSTSFILMIVLPILSFLLLTVASLVLYIYYRQEVKIWLFSKNLCLWFVSEEELDEDKIYDIFLSYSHRDEDFVIQNLLPVLETGPKPFKTCIHVRDWEGGEMILTHVNNSIANSRRTLVILSNNFLESEWGKVEFKSAHLKALEEGRTRLVVVKYGDLDEKRLDSDIKAYLSTNTYIEWGKPWFWNKLKYALPHSSKNGFYKSNQKHANVMLKIDDKFELTAPPLKQPESTPPVITLDPALLKKHPLHFNNVNSESNRPLEVPLVVNT
ncbi:unnamed protein product [Psylliodes chrysocephalus]|uniref:TIR domain-containing protein n=1 Tax=Psylliodes chrysocephalus TaxID=3402493 RepID=A0A9P0D9L3_9CUCU|nr:unnamed protein product [Psylliodes chrysocephala]